MAINKSMPSQYHFIYFFFYQGFLSRTRMIHRTAGEGRGPFFIPLYHFHPLMNIQTFICNFACEMTIHIFNRNACIYQTATRWYFTTLSNYHLFDWLMMWSLFLFTWWFDTRFLLQQFWYGKPVDSNYHPCITSEPTNQVCQSLYLIPSTFRFVLKHEACVGQCSISFQYIFWSLGLYW